MVAATEDNVMAKLLQSVHVERARSMWQKVVPELSGRGQPMLRLEVDTCQTACHVVSLCNDRMRSDCGLIADCFADKGGIDDYLGAPQDCCTRLSVEAEAKLDRPTGLLQNGNWTSFEEEVCADLG